jgi:hypothetical protein
VRFYCDVFGFTPPEFGCEARIALPSGQVLVLSHAPFGPRGMKLSRFEPGRRLRFHPHREVRRWRGYLTDN